MILVTVGTNGAPFDRLLQQLDDLSPGEEVIVQRGPSVLSPAGATCVDFLPFDELSRLVGSARVVVTHAGVGSVLLALEHGHRPIVVPRLKRFGEAVDDHQAAFGERLHLERLVRCIPDAARVTDAVAEGSTLGERSSAQVAASPLALELSAHLRVVCLPPGLHGMTSQSTSGRKEGCRLGSERPVSKGTT